MNKIITKVWESMVTGILGAFVWIVVITVICGVPIIIIEYTNPSPIVSAIIVAWYVSFIFWFSINYFWNE